LKGKRLERRVKAVMRGRERERAEV